MIAGVKGNIEVVACLIEAGADINIKDKFGMGCLHDKDVLENQNIVSIICKSRKADIDLPTNSGDMTPLVMACMMNSDTFKLTIDTLIGYNARVDGLDEGVVTPLGVCAVDGNLEVMESLLSCDAQVDKQDKSGRTALLRACNFNQMEAVNKLLNANANPSIADDDGDTPVMAAVNNNNEEMLDLLLLRRANVDIPKKLYKEDSREVLDYITPLSFAASKGVIDIVRKLVDAEADVNYVSEMYPYTPIVHAVYGSSHEIFKLLMSLPTLERSLEKLSWAVILSVRLHRENMTKELIRALGGYKHLMIATKDNEKYSMLRQALEKLTTQMQVKCERPLERQKPSNPQFIQTPDELENESKQSEKMALRICDEFVEIVMSVVTDVVEPKCLIESSKRLHNVQLVEFYQKYFNNKRENSGLLFFDFFQLDFNNIEDFISNTLDRPSSFVFAQKELFSGLRLKSKLQETGRTDFMDKFQTALLHLFPTEEVMSGFTVNGDMLMTSLLGLNLVEELRACQLLPQESKAFIDEDQVSGTSYTVVNQRPSKDQTSSTSEETVETLRKKVQELESQVQELLPLKSKVQKLEEEIGTLFFLVNEIQSKISR